MNKKIITAVAAIVVVLGFLAWHFFYKRPVPVTVPPVTVEEPVAPNPEAAPETRPDPPRVEAPARPKQKKKAKPAPKQAAPRARPAPRVVPIPPSAPHRKRIVCDRQREEWCSAHRRPH